MIVVGNLADFEVYLESSETYTYIFLSKDIELRSNYSIDLNMIAPIGVDMILNIEFYTFTVFYLVILLTLLVYSYILFKLYVLTFSRYEYIRYIYDNKYRFIERYWKIKFAVDLILLFTTLLKYGSIYYALVIIFTDIAVLLISRKIYLNRLIKLKIEK